MKTLVGTIIIIISLAIIAFDFWYNHFYLVAFGRGMPEALTYQKTIASFFTSIPFIVPIYLALRYLIFGSNDKRQPPVKSKWALSVIVTAFLGFAICWPITSGIIIGIYFSATQKGTIIACKEMVVDARNTSAAIENYYADPEHITLPRVDQLKKEEYLSTNHPVTIEEDSNGDPIITVIDENAECIKGKKLVYYFNGMAPEWKN
jgi:hypothetical protein